MRNEGLSRPREAYLDPVRRPFSLCFLSAEYLGFFKTKKYLFARWADSIAIPFQVGTSLEPARYSWERPNTRTGDRTRTQVLTHSSANLITECPRWRMENLEPPTTAGINTHSNSVSNPFRSRTKLCLVMGVSRFLNYAWWRPVSCR